MRLTAAGSGLSVADYFTPYNESTLLANDWDLGASSPLLVPNQTGTAHPNLLIAGTKEGYMTANCSPQGRLYVVDRTNMGHFQSGSDGQILQSVLGQAGQIFTSPAYWNHTVYFGGNGSPLTAFSLSSDVLSATPTSHTATTFFRGGTNPSISANGTTNGIVWALQRFGSTKAGELHAYNAAALQTELYNSNQVPACDGLNAAAGAFTAVTVVDGKVYFGANDLADSKGRFYIFGLLP